MLAIFYYYFNVHRTQNDINFVLKNMEFCQRKNKQFFTLLKFKSLNTIIYKF